jgi:hypothetical protein
MVFLLVFKSIVNLFLTTFYYADRDFFVENFCENTDKPELKCNGKCQLKKIAKETHNEDNTTYFSYDVKQLKFITESSIDIRFFTPFKIQKHTFFYSENYQFALNYFIDHPPKF